MGGWAADPLPRSLGHPSPAGSISQPHILPPARQKGARQGLVLPQWGGEGLGEPHTPEPLPQRAAVPGHPWGWEHTRGLGGTHGSRGAPMGVRRHL